MYQREITENAENVDNDLFFSLSRIRFLFEKFNHAIFKFNNNFTDIRLVLSHNCFLSEEEKRQTIAFILQYEQPEGGFSFSKTTPPTREDTYYAMRVLNKLNVTYSNLDTNQYLENTLMDLHHSCKHYFQLLFLLNLSSLEGHPTTMKNLLDLHRYLKEENINEIYYYMLISEIINTKFDFIIPNSKLSQDIVTLNYIPEVTRLIFVMNKLDLEFEEKKYIKWIQKTQSSDGGFGFLPYTTAFLENTCYALRGLNILNALPSNIDMCEKFVKSCRIGNGGYARKSDALGTLQSTYHAVCCHEIINQMKLDCRNEY